MLKKTEIRLEKRLISLPLHHIDSSVFLELFAKSHDARICESYLNKLLYNYRGSICIPAVGEIVNRLIENLSDDREIFTETFLTINRIIGRKKIEIYSFRKIPYEILKLIEDNDNRIRPLDAMNYACSVEDKAHVFVTIDRELMESQKLQNALGVKIRHPEELI